MKLASIVRSTRTIGVAMVIALGIPGVSMAATFSNPTSEGTITITTNNSQGNTGTATWKWSQLTTGEYVSVFAAPKSHLSNVTLLQTSSGKVTTNGQYTASVTLPAGDTWQNSDIEMTAGEFAVGGLPEVPWAVVLPLLGAVPFAALLWKRRSHSA